jgi:hypothetical protein
MLHTRHVDDVGRAFGSSSSSPTTPRPRLAGPARTRRLRVQRFDPDDPALHRTYWGSPHNEQLREDELLHRLARTAHSPGVGDILPVYEVPRTLANYERCDGHRGGDGSEWSTTVGSPPCLVQFLHPSGGGYLLQPEDACALQRSYHSQASSCEVALAAAWAVGRSPKVLPVSCPAPAPIQASPRQLRLPRLWKTTMAENSGQLLLVRRKVPSVREQLQLGREYVDDYLRGPMEYRHVASGDLRVCRAAGYQVRPLGCVSVGCCGRHG